MCAVGGMDRSLVPICVAGKSVACTIYNGINVHPYAEIEVGTWINRKR